MTANTVHTPQNTHQVQNLGLFRLFLAALVVVQHYQKLLFGEPSGLWIEALEIGSIAVLVFFVLSGYVIIGAIDRFYSDRPLAFLMNRVNRIVPLYLAVLAISAAVLLPLYAEGRLVDAGGVAAVEPYSIRNLVANLLSILPFAQQLLRPSYDFVSIAWAVQTEMTFYAIAFLALVGARLMRQSFAAVAWLAGAGFLALAAFRLGTGAGPQSLVLAPHFVLGGAFYYWRKSPSLVALGLAIGAALLMGWELLARPDMHEVLLFTRPHLVQLGVLAGLVLVMMLSTYRNPVPKPVDRVAGDYSYPLYLCHVLPATCAESLGAMAQPGLLWLGAALAGAISFSAIMLRLVDQPMIRLRDRVRRVSLA